MIGTTLSLGQIQAIERAVQELRPRVVEALQALVQTASQTGDEGAAQAVMAQLMRDHGLTVDVWEPEVTELQPYADSLTLGEDFRARPNVVGTWRGEWPLANFEWAY